MVFYFLSTGENWLNSMLLFFFSLIYVFPLFLISVVTPPVTLFMGLDKHESKFRSEWSSEVFSFNCIFFPSQTRIWSGGVGQRMSGFTWTRYRPLTSTCGSEKIKAWKMFPWRSLRTPPSWSKPTQSQVRKDQINGWHAQLRKPLVLILFVSILFVLVLLALMGLGLANVC